MSTQSDLPTTNHQHVTQPTTTSIPFPPSGPSTPASASTPIPPSQPTRPSTISPGPLRPNGQLKIPTFDHVATALQSGSPAQRPQSVSAYDRESAGRKRKWSSLGYNETEQDSLERTTTAFHYALAQDQLATLFPEHPNEFTSYEDVVHRLVPYHIWQTCDEELEGYEGGDEKRRTAQKAKGQHLTCRRVLVGWLIAFDRRGACCRYSKSNDENQ